MPRKKQTVQTKKRQKTYSAGEMSGEATHVKPKGAFKLFSNYPLFAAIGVIAITGGLLLAVLLGGGSRTADSEDNGVRGAGVIRTTPQAGETSTTEDAGASNTTEYSAPPAMSIDTAKTYTADHQDREGRHHGRTRPFGAAPQAVNNFVFLAKEDFYDGVDRSCASSWMRAAHIASPRPATPRAPATAEPGTSSRSKPRPLPSRPAPSPSPASPKRAPRNNGSQFFFT